MTNRLTQRNQFGIHQINFALVKRSSLLKDRLNQFDQLVQSADKLFIATKFGKLFTKIFGDQGVSFLQTCNSKFRLHQSNGQYFRIGKTWIPMIRFSPLGNLRMKFEKIVNKTVDFSQNIQVSFSLVVIKANRFFWSKIYFSRFS